MHVIIDYFSLVTDSNLFLTISQLANENPATATSRRQETEHRHSNGKEKTEIFASNINVNVDVNATVSRKLLKLFSSPKIYIYSRNGIVSKFLYNSTRYKGSRGRRLNWKEILGIF